MESVKSVTRDGSEKSALDAFRCERRLKLLFWRKCTRGLTERSISDVITHVTGHQLHCLPVLSFTPSNTGVPRDPSVRCLPLYLISACSPQHLR